MSVPDNLVEEIESTRITYPEREHGVTVRGAPFTCDFETPVTPEEFCDDVTTANDPWRMFGVKMQLADGYWKVAGTLFHVTDDEVKDASKISFEVSAEWMRIYVKEGSSADRVAEFVTALDEQYGVAVTFADTQEGEGGISN